MATPTNVTSPPTGVKQSASPDRTDLTDVKFVALHQTGSSPDTYENVNVPASAVAGVTAAQLAVVATSLPLRPTRTAAYTLVAADLGAIVPVSSSSAITLTVGANLGQAAPTGTDTGTAKVCYPLQVGTGLLTLAPAAGVTLLTRPGGGLKSPGPNGRLVLVWLDTNTVLVEGGVA